MGAQIRGDSLFILRTEHLKRKRGIFRACDWATLGQRGPSVSTWPHCQVHLEGTPEKQLKIGFTYGEQSTKKAKEQSPSLNPRP